MFNVNITKKVLLLEVFLLVGYLTELCLYILTKFLVELTGRFRKKICEE